MKHIGNGVEFYSGEPETDSGSSVGMMIEEPASERDRLIRDGLILAKFMSGDRKAGKFVKREGFPKRLSFVSLTENNFSIGSRRSLVDIDFSSRNGCYIWFNHRTPRDIIAHNLKSNLKGENIVETDKNRVLSLDYISKRYGDVFQNELFHNLHQLIGRRELRAYEYFALSEGFEKLIKTFPIYDQNDRCVYLADLTKNNTDLFYVPTNRQKVYFDELLRDSIEGLSR